MKDDYFDDTMCWDCMCSGCINSECKNCHDCEKANNYIAFGCEGKECEEY